MCDYFVYLWNRFYLETTFKFFTLFYLENYLFKLSHLLPLYVFTITIMSIYNTVLSIDKVLSFASKHLITEMIIIS